MGYGENAFLISCQIRLRTVASLFAKDRFYNCIWETENLEQVAAVPIKYSKHFSFFFLFFLEE
jgi:hypothetical protein